jgi:hypothetical protein
LKPEIAGGEDDVAATGTRRPDNGVAHGFYGRNDAPRNEDLSAILCRFPAIGTVIGAKVPVGR